jgi:hypothetical protein
MRIVVADAGAVANNTIAVTMVMQGRKHVLIVAVPRTLLAN